MSNAPRPIRIKENEAFPFNNLEREEKHLLLDKINDAIYDECPKILKFDFYKLPGLVFIDRYKYPKFISVKSEEEINLYIEAFGIIDSFMRDYGKRSEELRYAYKIGIREDIEKELTELKHEKNERFAGQNSKAENVLEMIVSVLRNRNVEEDDIKPLTSFHALQKFLKHCFYKYSEVLQSKEIHDLSRQARKQYQLSSLEEKISSLEERLKKSMSRKDLDNMAAMKDILQPYISKLTKFVLDEEIAEQILEGMRATTRIWTDYSSSIKPYYKLIDGINERSSKILNRINSLREKIDEFGYDIFISCKSQDYKNAHALHDFLKENGHRPFIADYALREIGTDKYGEIIRQVIDGCSYMIVFATDIDYISTEYVRHEWTLFYDEVMAGRKKGRLYAVIPSLANVPELPIEFRNTQCFEISSVEETILDFVKPIS